MACKNDPCSACHGGKGICRETIAAMLGLYWPAERRLEAAYRTSARRRGLAFELPREQFSELVAAACHYCGAEPGNATAIEDSGTLFRLRFQGIDRVDNARGYEPGNVVPCCSPCNTSKGDRPVGSFLARACRIAERAQ